MYYVYWVIGKMLEFNEYWGYLGILFAVVPIAIVYIVKINYLDRYERRGKEKKLSKKERRIIREERNRLDD